MTIVVRAYQERDFNELADIIRKTWHYDAFCDRRTATMLANVYLSSCLANQTFTRIALLDDKPVGMIMANHKAKHTCPIHIRLQQIKYLFLLSCTKEGRSVMKMFGGVSELDQQLYQESKTEYPAEIALFAIRPECRGKGIGKRLFQTALAYMKEEGLGQFYLFTDTSCNYGFYEHQGMRRRCGKQHSLYVKNQKADMNFFLYDDQV